MLTIQLNATNPTSKCPLCDQLASKIQSHYPRNLADLNWASYFVHFKLDVRRFWCLNPQCKRRIFCERLDQFTQVYARRTTRLTQFLQNLAFSLGGRPAVRLALKQGVATSRPTLLRLLEDYPLPSYSTPRVLGVDDFALKRGRTYGALLVDLEKHRPIEVLADRSTETFAQWLKEHPGVEIISRDRASSFAEAARTSAPKAIQVADRFHVLKNLTDHLNNFFQRKKVWKQPLLAFGKIINGKTALPKTEGVSNSASKVSNSGQIASKSGRLNRDAQLKADTYAKRLERYHKVQELSQKGLSNRQIATQLDLNRNTINRYIGANGLEVIESKIKKPRPSILDPYKTYLWRRWLEEQPTVEQLHNEVNEKGYTGSTGPIRAYLAALRPVPYWSATRAKERHQLTPQDLPEVAYQQKLSSREAAWLIFKLDEGKEELTEEQRYLLKQLLDWNGEVSEVYHLVQEFRQIVRKKRGVELDSWLERAKATGIKELLSFSRGIERDKEAVTAGLTLEYSNGQLEGQVNRVKNIKRQMFGRAKFKLLRTRVLGGS